MHIHFATTFGFENVYPKLVNSNNAQVHGEIQQGAKGLLEYLELHLGKQRLNAANAMRVSAFRKTILKVLSSHPNLYFAKSFSQDAWGTAQQLLVWRDELKLAGWEFNCDRQEMKRLHALSLIEKELKDLPKGVNDRWRLMIEDIRNWNVTFPIDKITVYEDRDLMNPFYIELFDLLSTKNVEVNYHPYNYEIAGTTDLANFQRKLSSNSKVEKVKCQNDGSLIILKADNDKLIADALGEYFSTNEINSKPVLVIPDRGAILEEAMVQRGLPAIGYTARLTDGAFDQLLSLIPLFLWKPIEIEKLMQFLTLPNAPIKKSLRNKLSRYYSNQKIDDVDELLEEEKIKLWFEKSKYRIDEGAPRDEVVAVYADLKKWALAYLSHIKKQEKAHKTEDKRSRPLSSLATHCSEIISLIQSEKSETELVNIIELQRWLNALEQDGFIRQYENEKNAFEYTMHPANLITACDHIVYWNFIENGNPIATDPAWTAEELAFLNIRLHNVDNRIQLWYQQQSNAVLQTKQQLILCIPDNQQGVEIESNALYYDLLATFHSILPMTNVIDVNSKIEISGKSIDTIPYSPKELPQSKISWQIDNTEKFVKREQDSYSSLSKLFFHPSAYVLNYLLKIRPEEIPEMEVTTRLKGNIAHHVAEALWKIEDLFQQSDDELRKTIREEIKTKIEKEGTIFLSKKHTVAKITFENVVLNSFVYLIQAIKENNWRFLEAEEKHNIYGPIPLNGYIDLVLIRADHEIAIVDLKWGGFTARKSELLIEQELQLLIYDRLLKEKYPDKQIHLQYYIITEQQFVARNNNAFSAATVIELETSIESNHRALLWEKMIATFNERWKQIEEGRIEVGDGFYVNAIANEFPMWQDQETYLSMPVASNRKETDRYSVYKNLNGHNR